MAATTIEQRPLYSTLVAGQEIIFTLSNNDALISHTRVKFVIDVHIGEEPINLASSTTKIATFKVTPNNSGVGMIDLSSIVEDYVSADNLAANGSTYKGDETTDLLNHPMHLIDKFSFSKNSARFMACKFKVEGFNSSGLLEDIAGSEKNSGGFLIMNGYLKYTEKLDNRTTGAPDNFFGYNMNKFFPTANDATKRFLTNAPDEQFANMDDYGTFSFMVRDFTSSLASRNLELKYYNSAGGQIGSDTILRATTSGSTFSGSNLGIPFSKNQQQFFGCFPANIRNWSTEFTHTAMYGGRIEVNLHPTNGTDSTRTYTIHINCENKKGYESIRLCWLNQWGAWDYYTFTQKSTRKISTKATTYDQLQGNWSSPNYNANGFKGGKKIFRKNATESITMNTDYVTEDFNVMFEELTNSPEVYILKGFVETTSNTDTLNRYVTPVTLKSSSFTRKTIANDKLIQYTFEVEKSRTLRTQSI